MKKYAAKILFFYYDIISKFTEYKEKICRSFAYAKFGWANYDFDYSSVYKLLSFKLSRLYNTLDKDPYHTFTPKDRKALLLAIKLCDNIVEDNYGDAYKEKHDKKWGELNFDGKNLDRSKVKTKKQKEQERKEFLEIIKKAEEDAQQDLRDLGDILLNASRRWWC
jgi:hypothetical protein